MLDIALRHGPFLSRSVGGDFVQLAIGKKELGTCSCNRLCEAPQLVGCVLALLNGFANAVVQRVGAIPTDRLADRLLRLEEAVDIGFREADRASQIRYGRLRVTIVRK